MKLVKVTWRDSAGARSVWLDDDETLKTVQIQTIGFLRSKKKGQLLLAMGRDDNDPPRWMNSFAIPNGCVIKIERLH